MNQAGAELPQLSNILKFWLFVSWIGLILHISITKIHFVANSINTCSFALYGKSLLVIFHCLVMIGWHKLRIYNVVALKTFQRVTIGENLEVWKKFGNSENANFQFRNIDLNSIIINVLILGLQYFFLLWQGHFWVWTYSKTCFGTSQHRLTTFVLDI